MVSNAPAIVNTSIMEEVIAKGDLSKLSPDQRATYYAEVCTSMGLNPLTQPFQYITLNQKLTLYATKTATDQLRTARGVSVFKIDAETVGDLRIVHAYARDASGREDMDIGAVNVKGLQGEALANAYMKALTKAKRRVTLSICGLGWLDESEIEAVPSARPITVNVQTGEIIETAPAEVVPNPGDERWEGGCTKRQLQRINILRQQKGVTVQGLKNMHGKASGKLMTEEEANDLIAQLLSYPDIELDVPDDDGPAEEEYDDRVLAGRRAQATFSAASDPDRFTR